MSLQNVNELKNFKNDIFFETGTYEGWLTRIAKDFGFTKVVTIEINNELYNKAISMSTEYQDIEFHLGNSVDIMKNILPNYIEEKITFWLDAHPSGYCDENTWPIFQELITIKNYSKRNDHIILIDDIRLFSPEQIEKAKKLALDINPDYKISFLEGGSPEDIMVCKIN